MGQPTVVILLEPLLPLGESYIESYRGRKESSILQLSCGEGEPVGKSGEAIGMDIESWVVENEV